MERRTNAWRLGVGLWVVMAMACTTEPGDDEGVANTSASTSQGSATGETADTGSGSADETAAPDCSEFEPQLGTQVEMSVINGTDAPIFLQPAGCGNPIRLTSVAGPAQFTMPDCDAPACHDAIAGQCGVACPGGGGACQVTVVRLDPGASYSRTWSGSVWVDGVLPVECVLEGCTSDCHRQVEANAGTYGIEVDYFEACPLEDPLGCECPNAEPSCVLGIDGVTMGELLMADTSFEYPAEAAPQLTIE